MVGSPRLLLAVVQPHRTALSPPQSLGLGGTIVNWDPDWAEKETIRHEHYQAEHEEYEEWCATHDLDDDTDIETQDELFERGSYDAP